MKSLPHELAYQVLWLQLADDGRDCALLGDNAENARTAPLPFLVGEEFPDVYFEFPLAGTPFLDVTVLLGKLAPGTRIDSEAAANTGKILDWFAGVRPEHEDVSFGFELDTHKPELPSAAIHFQPRKHLDFVEPFCEVAGIPEAGRLYLDRARRMPPGWDLSFFGMFRGRQDSPLRVCGYLGNQERKSCASDPAHLAAIFDEIGFTAYNDAMLAQASTLLAVTPHSCDFQFDIYPDGSLGDIFAFDVQFHIEQPKAVRSSFESGPIAKVFSLFEEWGAADERWKLTADAAFARALPMESEDGTATRFSLTLLPQWTKARWRNGKLQPAKLYYLAKAGEIEEGADAPASQ